MDTILGMHNLQRMNVLQAKLHMIYQPKTYLSLNPIRIVSDFNSTSISLLPSNDTNTVYALDSYFLPNDFHSCFEL